MLTFAGVKLLLPDTEGQLQAWLDRYHPLDDAFPFLEPASKSEGRTRPQGHWPHAVGMPTFNWSNKPPQWKLNTLWWPTGASRFSVGLFLIDFDSLETIQSRLSSDGSAELKISDGERDVAVDMYLLPPRPLSPKMAGTNPPVLLILVDKRYFWQWSKLPASSFGPITTWANVLSAINGALGTSVAASVDAEYLNPDWSEWVRHFENAALAMDAFAASTGHRFVAGLDGEFSLEKYAAAASTVSSNLSGNVYTAGSPHVIAKATAPGSLTVAFPKRQGGVPQQRGDCHQVMVDASDYGWTDDAAGNAVIHSTCQADFSDRSSGPSNVSQLEDLTGVIARDFYGWKEKQYSLTIPGVAGWKISGYDDYLWFHEGHQPPNADGCDCGGSEGSEGDTESEGNCGQSESSKYTFYTRVESFPPNFGFEEQLSQHSSPRTFRPMSIFRVRLTSEFQENLSGVFQASATLLYDATGTGELVTEGTEVTVFDTMGHRGDLQDGDNVWVSALAADSNMFELIASKAGSELIRFELYGGDLDLGGECDAKICVPDGDDWFATDDTITVMDPYDPGTWQGREGYQGFCVKRPPDKDTGEWDGKYDIVYMEKQAVFIEWEALEDRNPALTTFEAKLLYWSHGRKPPVGEDEKITIYDTAKVYPRILKECKGKAYWDDINQVYEANQAQQQALIIRGVALAAACPDDETISISGVEAMSNSPHGALPDPPPDEVINIGLACVAGDLVIASWDETSEDWRAIQVEHHKEDIMIDVIVEAGCIKKVTKEFAVMKCSDGETKTEIICISDCTE